MKSIKLWIQKHRIAAALIVVAVLAVGAARALSAKRGQDGEISPPLKRGTLLEAVYGIGTVTATRSFQLKTAVASNVRRIYVNEGDQVKQGAPLIDLQDTALVRAPFAGTVTALPFKVGETVFPQSVVLSLVDLSDRYITVNLEQQGALRVRHGQTARISFDSMRGETYSGRVESVYSNESNFLVRITAQGLPPQILPGMTADIAIGIREIKDALLVPVAAVHDGKVLVRRGGSSVTVDVKLGVADAELAEVVAGDLREGDRVVIRKKVAP